MARETITLKDGLNFGGKVEKTCVVRSALASDLIECAEQASTAMITPDGYRSVYNETVGGYLILGRQIVSIGPMPGPLDKAQLGLLTERDLDLIQDAVDRLREADYGELAGDKGEAGPDTGPAATIAATEGADASAPAGDPEPGGGAPDNATS